MRFKVVWSGGGLVDPPCAWKNEGLQEARQVWKNDIVEYVLDSFVDTIEVLSRDMGWSVIDWLCNIESAVLAAVNKQNLSLLKTNHEPDTLIDTCVHQRMDQRWKWNSGKKNHMNTSVMDWWKSEWTRWMTATTCKNYGVEKATTSNKCHSLVAIRGSS